MIAGYQSADDYRVSTASGSISGMVYLGLDEKLPLEGAIVSFSQGDEQYLEVESDQNGNYSLTLPDGRYNVRFSKAGYQSTFKSDILIKKDHMIEVDGHVLGNFVSGCVVDADTEEALSGVKVDISVASIELNKSVITDENGMFECYLTPIESMVNGEDQSSLEWIMDKNSQNIIVELQKDGYEGVTIKKESSVTVGSVDLGVISMAQTKYVGDLKEIASDCYSGNMGDSFIKDLGTRNGFTDIHGNRLTYGLEAWIARWNYTEEMSWAWVEYSLDSRYQSLSGKLTVIADSYNTDSFQTTIEIIGDGKVLYSASMFPEMDVKDVLVNVAGVNILRIYVYDTTANRGGTSFGLWDFIVMP